MSNLDTAVVEAGPSPAQAARLTVLTYNIRVGYGRKDPGVWPNELQARPKDLPPIVAAIRSVEPDIVALQEVLLADQAKDLAKALGMGFGYGPHLLDNDWWGLAILSKYPIDACRRQVISATRSALVCKVRVGDRPVTVFNVHRSPFVRDGSSARAIAAALQREAGPLVLLGDFNFLPKDPRLSLFTQRFADAALAAETETALLARLAGTYASGARIDYVFVDPADFTVEDAGVMADDHRQASDHMGFYAVIAPRF